MMTTKNKQTLYPLQDSCLYKLDSIERLLRYLHTKRRTLDYFLSLSLEERYYLNKTTKKDGSIRELQVPQGITRIYHDRIKFLLHSIQPPEYLFSPVKGRSNIDNAAFHREGNGAHNLDIKKYFPSTSSGRVYFFFRNIFKCSGDIAFILTNICCYGRFLPTGSPISAILAFWAHYPMWERINKLCLGEGCRFSVLMDDVTVSTPRLLVPPFLVGQIKEVIKNTGLESHPDKEQSFKGNQQKEITGVGVHNRKLDALPRHYEKLKRLQDEALQSAEAEERRKKELSAKGVESYINNINRLNQETM